MPLIVGLGNPGAAYEGTPHNVGFAVLAKLAARRGVSFRRSRSGRAEEAVVPGDSKTVLFRPLSYMNLSGEPVQAALRWHGLRVSDLLVVCDDVNLPRGTLRLRVRGGAGGQKGLLSIIEDLGSDEFARLRIGVEGGEPGADIAAHVLTKFPPAVRAEMERVLETAADAVDYYLSAGLEAAMNKYNTPRTERNQNNHPSGENHSPDDRSPQGDD
jgi:peptidyl-tRNA hydrolase, PTH1 family